MSSHGREILLTSLNDISNVRIFCWPTSFNVLFSAVAIRKHTSTFHTEKLHYRCSSPPMVIHTEPSSAGVKARRSVIHTDSRHCGFQRGMMVRVMMMTSLWFQGVYLVSSWQFIITQTLLYCVVIEILTHLVSTVNSISTVGAVRLLFLILTYYHSHLG